jgi:RecJ-like exonuclease
MELKANESEFLDHCKEARKLALSFSDPLLVHHHDADGVSSGAIVYGALQDIGRKPRTKCIRKLDDKAIDELMNEKEIIFSDLGGGNKRVNELKDVVIIDHHQTEGIEKMQANPMLFGIEGSDELSGSGAAYCVFKNSVDLGIVGAVGDMQSPLHGMNRWVLDQGVQSGEVKIDNDLRFYGRYCRNLLAFLTYSDDPYIPLISYHEDRAQKLLDNLGIPTKTGNSKPGTERWRVYADLSEEEKKKLISELANILINCRMVKKVDDLIGESYVFPKHEKDETYEANEFSTLLNACGRHRRSDIGLRVCLGDKTAFDEARALLSMHRKMIREGISFAQNNIQDLGKFFFLDARNVIDESIIGTVIGMVQRATWTKPILGVSNGEDETIKFSSRANRALVEAGLNLASVMAGACEASQGIGGGHKIAAGASIPKGKINEFLLAVGSQLGQST